jgi:uncharacterized RDD family membrane protein YckC
MSDEPSGPVYAGAVSRLSAYVVDLAIMSTLLAGGSAVAAFLIAVVTGHELGLRDDRDVARVAAAIWWVVYFAGSWALTGRTPGMALFGLEVVRPEGSTITPASAVVRALVFPLSVLLFGLGFVGILIHPQRRALHDLIARTAVTYSGTRAPAWSWLPARRSG